MIKNGAPPVDNLNSRERTQIAYLANAPVHYPELCETFYTIADEERLGSEGVSQVLLQMRRRFRADRPNPHKRLKQISKDFSKQTGPLPYMGLALAGSLMHWSLRRKEDS